MEKERSDVLSRRHLSLDPKPMYIDNELGHEFEREMGLATLQMRLKSQLDTKDVSNEPGKRGRGNY